MMRPIHLRLLAAVAAALVVYPVLAQFPGGGGRGPGGDPDLLLLNKSVQDELKLTDGQKSELAKLSEKQRESMKKAFESGDKDKAQEVMKSVREEMKKDIVKAKDALTADQTKRLHQIELQVKGIRAFTEEDVQAKLKLNDKQKDEIKAVVEEATKDAAELFKEAQGDRSKFREVGKKVQSINAEALTKVTGQLTDDQKSTWKELTGDKFELKMDFGGGKGGFKGGKKKGGGDVN